MKLNKSCVKDERAIHFENISYRFGYHFISYALLIDVIYRSLILKEAPWDLLVIIIISGLVMTTYQFSKKTIDVEIKKNMLITTCITFFIAFLTVIIINIMK